MARVTVHNYEACQDSDPDTNHGFEERIYVNMAVRPLGQHLAEIFDAADSALLRSRGPSGAYMCQHRTGEYRDIVYICSPTELAVEAINRWVKQNIDVNTMMPIPLPPIYLAARPSFDRDKLMVLLMKAPENAFL